MSGTPLTQEQLIQIAAHLRNNPPVAEDTPQGDTPEPGIQTNNLNDNDLLQFFHSDEVPDDCDRNEQYIRALQILSRQVEIGLKRHINEITRDDMISYFMDCLTRQPEDNIFEFKHNLLMYLCDEAVEEIMNQPYYKKHYPLFANSTKYNENEIVATCSLSDTFATGKLQNPNPNLNLFYSIFYSLKSCRYTRQRDT